MKWSQLFGAARVNDAVFFLKFLRVYSHEGNFFSALDGWHDASADLYLKYHLRAGHCNLSSPLGSEQHFINTNRRWKWVLGTREMAQRVRLPIHKHGDLNSGPNLNMKKGGRGSRCLWPSLGDRDSWSASLSWNIKCQVQWETFAKIRWRTTCQQQPLTPTGGGREREKQQRLGILFAQGNYENLYLITSALCHFILNMWLPTKTSWDM